MWKYFQNINNLFGSMNKCWNIRICFSKDISVKDNLILFEKDIIKGYIFIKKFLESFFKFINILHIDYARSISRRIMLFKIMNEFYKLSNTLTNISLLYPKGRLYETNIVFTKMTCDTRLEVSHQIIVLQLLFLKQSKGNISKNRNNNVKDESYIR